MTKDKKTNIKMEKVPMAIIYKQDGFINVEYSEDSNRGFEIFGFLKCLVNKMEDDLTESICEKGK